ncbi:glycosyltransferase family 92 protein [Treponema sp. Marseille-Q3903]|uniref:glycosyltransferase family 92 protein n=1 Tax=Treponema sp. Marseille-Q3903 TaxID=2766703 RepID=UPI001651C0A7|nr:glycosyltransferase family 92 protein [Treponema sp. Marseille-Q3903]MBC6713664.1 glycosyltransferase family 92 protein [Treponema sp. Marseille-Q3903]
MKTLYESFIDFRFFLEKVYSFFFRNDKEKDTYEYNISYVLIFKNEVDYIREWIEYHRLISGQNTHFYLYDNKSTDNPKFILQKYIDDGIVTYKYVNAETYPQVQIYTDAILRYRFKTRYMVFIDADEFIVPTDSSSTLQDIIDKQFSKKNVGGICINWLCFGSSGRISKPEGLVIESYLQRSKFEYDANKHIKTIANPRKVMWFSCAHNPKYYKNNHNINDEDEFVDDFYNLNRTYKLLSLHHYASKSLEESEKRVQKGFGKKWYGNKTNSKHSPHDFNDVFDDSILRYAEEVKKRLQL